MNKLKFLIPMLLLALPLWCRGQAGNASNPFPTNISVLATDTIFTNPYPFNWLSACNDSTTTIYCTPGMTFSNVSITNITTTVTTNGIAGVTIITQATNVTTTVIAASIGQGIRLNASGGCVFFDAGGRPSSKYLHFISTLAGGQNVAIEIGATSP